MATHSSILAWRIPRTEEPGGLQSMWSQRVRQTEQLTLFLDHQCLSVCSVAGTVWVLGICQGRKQRKIPAFMELQGFTGGSDGKESVCNAGDLGLIPESGRSPGEGNGNPLQYFCLGNPITEEPGKLQSLGSQRVRHN